MAQKKVILKGGADELLPKTSASMVFTESGQTVENALKNAGSGGTGDSGIVDITSIYSKLNIQNGGIMGSEDLTALKGHIAAGKVLKVTMDGTTLTFSYNTSDTLITLSSSPMVTPAVYGAMMVVSLLVDSETGEYVGVTDESSGYLVQQMIPSNVNAAQLCTMNGYTKPSAYSAISPTDSINTALGKLEAGIGSGGAGDDVYYLPVEVYQLDSGCTEEDFLEAFGGEDGISELKNAMENGKRIYIRSKEIYNNILIPVSYTYVLLTSRLAFLSPNAIGGILVNILLNSKEVHKISLKGYSLKDKLLTLTADSNTDSISLAVNGESGLKAIIQAVENGNRLYSINLLTNTHQYLLASKCSVEDNGDMMLSISGIGPNLWGGYGGILTINYTKSSNTFSCAVIPISMGS